MLTICAGDCNIRPILARLAYICIKCEKTDAKISHNGWCWSCVEAKPGFHGQGGFSCKFPSTIALASGEHTRAVKLYKMFLVLYYLSIAGHRPII